jgi:predicted DNA-binding WGR domain protein
MWTSTQEFIKTLTQKQAPLIKEELADVLCDEPVFWTIETTGASYTVTTGKLGTAGESQTTTFDSENDCQKAAHDLYDEKMKKYYPLSYFNLRPNLTYQQSPQTKELEENYAALLKTIESLSAGDLAKLPEAIANPRAVLDALNDKEIIETFTSDILSSALNFKQYDFEAQGVAYEWYYDGENNYNEAYGYFYEKCWFKGGVPKLGGKSEEEVGSISVGLVMDALYESLDELYDCGFSNPSLISQLFEAKVFLLAERAYREAEKWMVLPFFFMNQHDDDLTFIAAPVGKAGKIVPVIVNNTNNDISGKSYLKE